MDFTFSDASSSFLNMIQPDLPREVMFDADNAGSKKPLFAEKLSKTLKKADRLEDQAFRVQTNPIQVNLVQAAKDPVKAMDSIFEKLKGKKGISFVSVLKNIFLMLSKGDLKNISIDADGLEALKKMLLKAGFKENDINDLIVEFTEELENKTLSLDDLFDKLFELVFEAGLEIETEQENFLETSAIPFIESILTSLGIPRDKIQEILIQADKGDKGISLDVVIEKLQNLQEKSFYTQIHYKTREGDDNFKMLFKQLGIEQNESKISPLTLDELVESFEKLRTKVSQNQIHAPAEVSDYKHTQKPIANEKSLDLLDALFKGLEFKNKEADTQVFKFSYEQIKDQFKNELLVPGEEKINKKDLFSFDKNIKPATDTKLKDGFKAMDFLLPGKKIGAVDMNDQLKDSKGFLKQLKFENAKQSDQGQVSTSDVKSGQTQSGLNILKTKSSFRNLPTYVTHQVSKSLVRAINQGENILKIQLKPPELGRLVMTIDNTGNNMKVSIMTENFAAKEILISNVNELRSVLSNSGVHLERFDVDMNSNFKQSMADAGNQAGNSGKQQRNKEKPVNGEVVNDPINLLDSLNQEGSLHFVA
ncbi:MAG: flagellar hook-length control protein FliK [Bacteroidales bacterium]|nr:flagellar hook-length control protein FliK [Bacteroidales bacterium]